MGLLYWLPRSLPAIVICTMWQDKLWRKRATYAIPHPMAEAWHTDFCFTCIWVEILIFDALLRQFTIFHLLKTCLWIHWGFLTSRSCRNWWLFCLQRILEECSTIYSLPTLLKKKMEISSCSLILLFSPWSVHSGSASWDDCGQVFPGKLLVS